MRPHGLLVLLLAGGSVAAQEGTDLAPETAVIPETRPGSLAEHADPGSETGEGSRPPPEDGSAPEPVTREERAQEPDLSPDEEPEGTEEDAAADAAPDESPALIPSEEAVAPDARAPDAEPRAALVIETPEEMAACLAALDELGVTYERGGGPILEADNLACGIANPVVVSEIAPGVLLEPASPMRCATALATARWAADVVVPLGHKLEGRGGVTAINQGAPYVCRPRADGAPSEHSTGAALDVMGFRFANGEPIPVEPRAGDGTAEEAFQRAVRAGACLDFSTVLGPGSDEAHADHLHFDIKSREGGFRICE